MPIYDYRCTQCGHEVEVIHPIGGTGPETCERCGGVMRKALSAPAIHFKGSGWAKKDAQTASKPKSAAGKSDADTGGGSEADSGGGEKASGKDAGDAKAKTTTSEPPAKAATGTATD